MGRLLAFQRKLNMRYTNRSATYPLFFNKVFKMPILRFLVLLPILALVGCANSWQPPVKIVIPSRFRGEFRIIESQDGLRIIQEEGEYRITIPQNGQIFVKSLDCFINYHTETITDDKGNILKHYLHSSRAADDVFGVFGGGLEYDSSVKRRELHYFVGTAKEVSKMMHY